MPLSYGYLMGMLRISFGKVTIRERKCTDNGPLLGYVYVARTKATKKNNPRRFSRLGLKKQK